MSFRLFGFGDHSDSTLELRVGEDRRHHWTIRDAAGEAQAVSAHPRGFDSYQAARANARAFVRGLGADFSDVEIVP